MSEQRPNPDELLSRVEAEEAKARRGRLKIFFGYAAGVGKTFAMLEAAQREKASGIDVVVGYVEPHGRVETEKLLHGLEAIPPRLIPYRGVNLLEFDLDAALARHPQILLVDELAHTNAEGCRHSKRWQDVFELLDAGIDVFTTLNVQHIESLNDVIVQITNVTVRETLPDAVIDRADDMELIDITPDELLQRLEQGKVYISSQAERALQHFFQQPKLAALRELSLRQTARRLQRDVDEGRLESRSQQPWPTTERLIVCVGPSPTGAKLIRAAKRMADALDAEWLAVSVSMGDQKQATSHSRQGTAANLRLAESLGAEAHQLVGDRIAPTILEYARSRNVSRVLVGKTAEPTWRRLLLGSVVDDLIKTSGEIDVFLIQGEEESDQRSTRVPRKARKSTRWSWVTALVLVAIAALVGWPMRDAGLAEANIVMVFLAAVCLVSAYFGRGPSILASVASVLVFDLFFVLPYYSFAVADAQYILTFAVMLVIGLLISTVTTRVRQQMIDSQERERATHALYRMSKQLSEAEGVEFLLGMAGQGLAELFESTVVIFLRGDGQELTLRYGKGSAIASEGSNAAVAEWVAAHGLPAGQGTDTLPKATALFLPLIGSRHTVGVVGIKTYVPQRLDDPDQRLLLDTCVRQIALAIERDQMSLKAYESRLDAESERLRSSLLSSVSHDLRTPLSVISGATSSLLASAKDHLSSSEQSLARSVVDESNRLAQLVDNLLDMTRLESTSMKLVTEPYVLEELVGSALARTEPMLGDRPIHINIPRELGLVDVDGILVEQLLINLLENAARYTPAGSPVEITGKQVGKSVQVTVADRGPGVPLGSESRLFEKFFRGTPHVPDSRRGAGLGLAICKAIVDAHGGTIEARNRDGGGAEFVFTLPIARVERLVPEVEEKFSVS